MNHSLYSSGTLTGSHSTAYFTAFRSTNHHGKTDPSITLNSNTDCSAHIDVPLKDTINSPSINKLSSVAPLPSSETSVQYSTSTPAAAVDIITTLYIASSVICGSASKLVSFCPSSRTSVKHGCYSIVNANSGRSATISASKFGKNLNPPSNFQ